MFSRPSTMFLLLGAAVAVPFAANKASDFSGFSGFGAKDKPAAVSVVGADHPAHMTESITPVATQQGNAYQRIAEVIRMDISPDWVFHRWDRKSTKLANLDRFGVRVPCVTGTQADDLAGSLTYYFGAGNRVERISFHGRTGDPRALTHLVTRMYGMTPQQPIHPGEQLYQSKWNDRVKSELRLTLAPVLSSKTTLNAFDVSLEIERPDSNAFLDDERPQPVLPKVEPEKPATPKAKEAEPKQKWIQGPPMSRSMYFNPQRTKPITKGK